MATYYTQIVKKKGKMLKRPQVIGWDTSLSGARATKWNYDSKDGSHLAKITSVPESDKDKYTLKKLKYRTYTLVKKPTKRRGRK